ncbi:UDP-N-acetylenolpyruvoylglucosamine reductase [Priestia megaterium]|nr:UDP-N-acetylenolpyruvoylglucosamine reductase [Priestia megaterium]
MLEDYKITYKTEETLAKYTTWRIGGPADIFISPESEEELQVVIQTLYEKQIPWFTIGKGSNLLVKDSGFRGAIIKLGKEFDDFAITENVVTAKGGCSLVKLSLLVSKEGLSGLEFAGGIPGTVGGAICMNAGAHGQSISDILIDARVMTESGEIVTVQNSDLKFSYRHSNLANTKGIVLDARFKVTPGDQQLISKKQADLKEYRMSTQPLKERSCGSVFTNPYPNHSAQLIEQLGLKGHQIGGAKISDKHSNFIVNVDNASADDVLNLIHTAQARVKEELNIELHPEVKVIGE